MINSVQPGTTLYRSFETAILSPDYTSSRYVEEYLKPHMQRFCVTLRILQGICEPTMRIIDIGSYASLVPPLQQLLGLREIVVTTPHSDSDPVSAETSLPNTRNGHEFLFRTDRFNLEERFPYSDETFDVAIFTEVLEHLAVDPMHTLSEINRITKGGGWIVLSTPSCASAKSVLRILRGGNPNCYPIFTKQPSRDRHNREYTPWEVRHLLMASGYEVNALETLDVYQDQHAVLLRLFKAGFSLSSWVSLGMIKRQDRGDTIFALARKTSAVRDRYPVFLYA